MSSASPSGYALAVMDFRRARRSARLQALLARLRGRSEHLLSYEEVKRKLKGLESPKQELREIPLDAIVGSVGRYRDFTRTFLPLTDGDESRWARVKAATMDAAGVPPIEVYQIGEAYFVRDGNHRVSVARQMGSEQIQAYVKQVQTKVPISFEIDADELIVKAEYADFLARTDLDKSRPQMDLEATIPSSYAHIEEQIRALQEAKGQNLTQAAASWYDEVYLPMIELFRDQGLLQDYPGLTELDLFVWVYRYRSELEQRLGWEVRPETAAADLATNGQARSKTTRFGANLVRALTPDRLASGPPAGTWRQEVVATRRSDRFSSDILVPLSGEERSWIAWDQALIIAEREQARVLGLHVVSSKKDYQSQAVGQVQAEFDRRCREAGKACSFAIDVGRVSHTICARANWADLVVVKLSHPPGEKRLSRLGSGFRRLIRRCSRPIMAVPREASPLSKLLLAYDGSPKADEALFLSTYVAGRWGIPLVIVSVQEKEREPVEVSETYMHRREVQPTIVSKSGDVAHAILETAQEHDCDFITMGGYGLGALREVVLGSTVDGVLRASHLPVLICR